MDGCVGFYVLVRPNVPTTIGMSGSFDLVGSHKKKKLIKIKKGFLLGTGIRVRVSKAFISCINYYATVRSSIEY